MAKPYSQVYSLIRQDRGPVLLDALKTFAEIGYEGVEGIGTNTGGLSISDFKKFLADLNLDMCSVMGLNNAEEWEFANEVGARFVVANFGYGSNKRDDILRACESHNALSAEIKRAGLLNIIHNHATEFEWVDDIEGGIRVFDLIAQNTDPSCVGFELDVGWTMFGGVNPDEVISKYSGRIPIIHVKECSRIAKDHEEREHFPKKVLELGPPKDVNGGKVFLPLQEELMYNARNFNCELGNGIIDWNKLTAAAAAQNIPVYYVNEREYFHCYGVEGDKVTCIQKDCEFIRSL